MEALRANVRAIIGSELIPKLEPVFEKSASNQLDSLVSVDDDISELIVSPLEDSIPSVLHALIVDMEGSLAEVKKPKER